MVSGSGIGKSSGIAGNYRRTNGMEPISPRAPPLTLPSPRRGEGSNFAHLLVSRICSWAQPALFLPEGAGSKLAHPRKLASTYSRSPPGRGLG